MITVIFLGLKFEVIEFSLKKIVLSNTWNIYYYNQCSWRIERN